MTDRAILLIAILWLGASRALAVPVLDPAFAGDGAVTIDSDAARSSI